MLVVVADDSDFKIVAHVTAVQFSQARAVKLQILFKTSCYVKYRIRLQCKQILLAGWFQNVNFFSNSSAQLRQMHFKCVDSARQLVRQGPSCRFPTRCLRLALPNVIQAKTTQVLKSRASDVSRCETSSRGTWIIHNRTGEFRSSEQVSSRYLHQNCDKSKGNMTW